MGKVRGRVTAPADADDATLEELARGDANVAAHLDGKQVVKVIVVPASSSTSSFGNGRPAGKLGSSACSRPTRTPAPRRGAPALRERRSAHARLHRRWRHERGGARARARGSDALLVVAYYVSVPYPIVLVLGGLALGFAPGIPNVELEPDLVLVLFLPPLLYGGRVLLLAARPPRQPRARREPVDRARDRHHLRSGMGRAQRDRRDELAAAFTLGAVLAPTDPVAATAIAGRLGAPKRFVTVVEGESLINDATALIIFKFAVAATVRRGFSAVDAVGRVRAQLDRRHRDRHRDRLGRRSDPPTDRRSAHRDLDLAPTPFLAYHPPRWWAPVACSPPSPPHLAGVAGADPRDARDAPAVDVRLGGADVRAERRALRAARHAAPGHHRGGLRPVRARDAAALRSGGVDRGSPSPASSGLRAAGVRRVGRNQAPRDAAPARALGETLLVAFTGMRGAVSLAAALAIP